MDTQAIERPEFVTDEHLDYLDDLRESGITNMYGAPSFVKDEFGVDWETAAQITSYWMKTFSQRRLSK